MVPTSTEPSISDAAILRAYAPACLREPYLRAIGARGLPHQRPAWAFGFVEHLIRYLLALLAPEGAADLGDQQLDLWRADRQKLSDGALFNLAYLLAKAVRRRPDAVATPAAAYLVTETGRRTDAGNAIERLLAARNEVAHGDTGPLSSDPATLSRFDEAWVHDLRAVTQGLTFVKTLPLYALDTYDARLPQPRLLCFAGSEPRPMSLPSVPAGVPVCEPLLIAPDGRWVALGPILGLTGAAGGLVPRLLDIGRRRHVFTDPHGESRVAPLAPWRASWLDGKHLRPPLAPGAAVTLLAEAVARPPAKPPDLGPDYRADALLERGSSAAVWLATDRDGRTFAAKVLHEPLRVSEVHRQRLHREVRLLTRCNHASLVRTHGVLEDCPAAPVLLMDYVSGGDLGRAYSRHRASPEVAAGLVLQLLKALAHLHAHQVVHRDIKPANVLLTAAGQVVLVDLGVARDGEDARLTGTLDSLGTPQYAAPEQFRGERVDGRADLYAVGRLLAWLVGGELAFERGDLSGLPSGLAAVVRRATRPVVQDRFADAAAMAKALEAALLARWQLAPLSMGDEIGTARITGPPAALGEAMWCAEAEGIAFKEPRRLWFSRVGHADELTLRARVARWPTGWSAGEHEGLLVVSAARSDELPALDESPSTPAPEAAANRALPTLQLGRSQRAALGTAALDPTPVAVPEPVGVVSAPPSPMPAWFLALPDLETLPAAQVNRRLALESGLAIAAVWAGRDGNAPIARWFGLRSSHGWGHAHQMLARVCTEDRGTKGLAVSRAWARIAAQPDERSSLNEVRGLLKRFAAERLEVPEICVLIGDLPAILWDAHPTTGAVLLHSATGAAPPEHLGPRLAAAWLHAGLAQLDGVGYTTARGDTVVGFGAHGREVALALRVRTLQGRPRLMPDLAIHLGWVQQSQVRLIGLTDGERWRWLRRQGQRDLLEAVGDPADHLRT